MGSVVALAGFSGAANASATIDLIWINTTDTDCTQAGRRDCPQLGTTLSSVALTSNITLAVILTAGAGGIGGAFVSVDYSEFLPEMSVVDFRRFNTEPFLPISLGMTSDIPPFIDNINAVAAPFLNLGIGLPVGVTAYLGTVTFHKDAIVDDTLEIHVGTNGPRMSDAIIDLSGNDISETSTFNSAFLTDGLPVPDCLCEVQNINPNQIVLKNVANGGSATKKMVVIVHAVDNLPATCDFGEISKPTSINLKMVDDDGDVLIDSSTIVECEGGGKTANVKINVFFQGPADSPHRSQCSKIQFFFGKPVRFRGSGSSENLPDRVGGQEVELDSLATRDNRRQQLIRIGCNQNEDGG